jgi:anti-sigma B factor antagonist
MTHHTPPLDLNATAHGEVTVVEMAGSIDSLTAEDLMEALQQQIREGRIRLVGDMRGVSYISSAGLRALLSATKESRNRGGDLRLAGVTDHVHKVLDLSGFTSILHVYPDAAAAIESFAS